MRNNLEKLITLAHENAKSKGFWPEERSLFFKDRTLLLVVSEITEAMEALRIDHFAEIGKFNNCMGEQSFSWCFEEYIKNSFQDEIADAFIRLLDYCGGFNMKIDALIRNFDKTFEGLNGMEIADLPAYLFSITKSIVDIKYQAFGNQYVGEVLAKLYYVMNYKNFDLYYHIEMKMKYNATREHKHGKNF